MRSFVPMFSATSVALVLFVVLAPMPSHAQEQEAEKAAGSPKVQIKVIQDAAGNISRRETYYVDENGNEVEHGVTLWYDSLGDKRSLQEYSHGKLHGRYVVWFDAASAFDPVSGREFPSHGPQAIRLQGAYVEGRKHGVWREWNVDGARSSVCRYDHGRKSGTERLYRPVFTDGADRLWLKFRYDKSGQLIKVEEFYAGGGVRRRGSYDPESKGPKSTWSMHEVGVKQGTWKYFAPNGDTVAEGEWRDGVPWNGVCCLATLTESVGSVPSREMEVFAEYQDGRQVRELPTPESLGEEKHARLNGPSKFPDRVRNLDRHRPWFVPYPF